MNAMRRLLVLMFALLAGAPALAQTVSMSGAFTGKALLMIDGKPRTVAVGDTVQGVKLVAVTGNDAIVEVKGKRATLVLGGAQVSIGNAAADGGASKIMLSAGSGGHFLASGAINGRAVRFMVDTGASLVGIGAAEAELLGIDYRKGQRGTANTANRAVPAYVVTLASVRVGEVTVYNVEALVTPQAMPYVLLGNSFLGRFQIKRENDLMTLNRRY